MKIDPWLDRLDRLWDGKVIPFVLGLNVGIVLTVIVFVISYIALGGR